MNIDAELQEKIRAKRKEMIVHHDPHHPYVKRHVGCGHGKLFTEPCVDCEIVGLMDEYRRAVQTIRRVRDRMRVLGHPMLGEFRT